MFGGPVEGGSATRQFLLLGVTVCMMALAIEIPLPFVAARVGVLFIVLGVRVAVA